MVTTTGSFFFPENGMSGERSFLGKLTMELAADEAMSERDRPSVSWGMSEGAFGVEVAEASLFLAACFGAAARGKLTGSRRAMARTRWNGDERLMAVLGVDLIVRGRGLQIASGVQLGQGCVTLDHDERAKDNCVGGFDGAGGGAFWVRGAVPSRSQGGRAVPFREVRWGCCEGLVFDAVGCGRW